MTQWGLDSLFNPAKRHMDEEKRRLQSTREEAGDSSGGRRIDLEAGKVTIRRSDAANGGEDSEPDAPASDAGAAKQKHAANERDGAGGGRTPSAAAIRAAKRRGRTPR